MSAYETELEKYEIEYIVHTEERIDKYRPGGLHPVAIEDTFSNGRYTVYNKLGHGGSSTVWVALDESTDEWVAIKILTAERSRRSRELRSYQRLARLPQELGLSTYFVQLRDHFFHQGPNGKHLCLVTELLGPRLPVVLEQLGDKDTWLAPNIVLKVAQRLLEAIEVLHRAGFTHGDLNMNNIVFTCRRLASIEGGIWTELTSHVSCKLVRRDGSPLSPLVPKEYVETEPWYDWNDEEFEEIKILDLGETFRQGQKPSPCTLPGECRAPEVIFEDSFDHRTDLWQAGCAIYMLVFHMFPFYAIGGDRDLVLTMMDILGDLPKEWIPRWEKIQQASIYSSGPLDPESANGRRPNPSIYYGTRKVPEETLRILVPVIKGLLTYKRSSRLPALEALQMLEKLKSEEGDGTPALS